MTQVKASRFTIMVHLLHRESIGHSPGGRTGNHGRTQANDLTARVKEEAASDGMTHTAQKILSRMLKFMCHISMRILCVTGEEISSPGSEDHGSSDNSEGSFEPLFMLSDRQTLTEAQEMKVVEKVEAIESALPIYVAIMGESNVCRRNSGMSLVSSRTS
jgi:hypothetical protein